MSAVVALPARLDLPAIRPLAADLRAARGADLTLAAQDVTHLGALGLQLLMAAQAEWSAGGHRLTLSPRSEAFDAALDTFGMTPSALQVGAGT